jgi:hypothetical protein
VEFVDVISGDIVAPDVGADGKDAAAKTGGQ